MANKTERTTPPTRLQRARVVPAESSGDRIRNRFRDDAAVRAALAEGMAERLGASAQFVARAAERFNTDKFAPSLFTQREPGLAFL